MTTTCLDLPDEICLLIGAILGPKALYSCIRVCRAFYASFIPCLWSNINVKPYKCNAIDAANVRANAHRINTASFAVSLTEEYYTIIYPRLQEIRLDSYDKGSPNILQAGPQHKIHFAQLHPTIRKLNYGHEDILPKEFWEVVETTWTDFESLGMSGVVGADAVDVFWRVCDRVQDLRFTGVNLPESLPILSTLSFRRLQSLGIALYPWSQEIPHRTWPVQLLEQVKTSEGLRSLSWDMTDTPFPVQLVLDALEEGCWPQLSSLSISDPMLSDQDLSKILRILPPRRLTDFEWSSVTLGPFTYNCLREMYFSHLRELNVGQCSGVTSTMTQAVLTECVHLVRLDAPHVFVRDIATSPKPWGCLRLESLVLFIGIQKYDEPEWEGQVFRQISKLKRLQSLDLQRNPHSFHPDIARPSFILNMATLDLGLPAFSSSTESSDNSGGDIRCWSNLVQLQEFSFDGDRQAFGMDEALWMVEHWKDLWCVVGEFTAVEENDNCKLEKLFLDHNISHY
ncbi:hypothetical protein BGZ95_003981 [Linnemannia exigua]|uniref:F-box domain-containing protein n=1 Tax=Linnemannia exigua TaxID=604196 RepID=A0AAD4H851_9FUNG|nr:hypothetical protein BGZ95_003981 [Linnemannia exigua]